MVEVHGRPDRVRRSTQNRFLRGSDHFLTMTFGKEPIPVQNLIQQENPTPPIQTVFIYLKTEPPNLNLFSNLQTKTPDPDQCGITYKVKLIILF